jgi:hypothetical protein
MAMALSKRFVGGAGPLPARNGALGVCQVCQEPAVTHFDTSGRFVGCTEVEPNTVFVLVPVGGVQEPVQRGAARYRYFAAENPPDTAPRRPKAAEIYEAIKKAGVNGVLKSELEDQGFSHGSLGGNCKWLRDQGYIRVVDDSDWQQWHDAHS